MLRAGHRDMFPGRSKCVESTVAADATFRVLSYRHTPPASEAFGIAGTHAPRSGC